LIFACSRLTSRTSEEPSKSIRELSTRDDNPRFVAIAKGMRRCHRPVVGDSSRSCCIQALWHSTQRRVGSRTAATHRPLC
jgi:hypothetical protein